MNLDISEDYLVFDQVRTVIFYTVDLEGNEIPFTDVKGLRQEVTGTYVNDLVEFVPDVSVWNLFVATMPPGITPKRMDKIRYAGVTYQITNDNIESLDSRYECYTQVI